MKNKMLRITLAVSIPLMLAAALFVIVYIKPQMYCPFYCLTGLYCPGCGSGRAVEDILAGNIKEAFYHNMLLFILGIPSAIVLIYEYLRLFVTTSLPPVVIPKKVYSALVILVFTFWILRNIPVFHILAP